MHKYNITEENLVLYHGSMGLIGDDINLRSGSGVGWNSLTLGDAFYTTVNSDAAQLFSHLVLQKSKMRGEEALDNIGFAKVYQIFLNGSVSILDADKALDASRVRSILIGAGVSERYLKVRHDDQLVDFQKSADLLCYGMDWEGNRNEYLTKALGFDALMIKERAWEGWDYFPEGIGIDWRGIESNYKWPPKTVAIYNTEMISSHEIFRDGLIIQEKEHSFQR
jgi:hypothetical protein